MYVRLWSKTENEISPSCLPFLWSLQGGPLVPQVLQAWWRTGDRHCEDGAGVATGTWPLESQRPRENPVWLSCLHGLCCFVSRMLLLNNIRLPNSLGTTSSSDIPNSVLCLLLHRQMPLEWGHLPLSSAFSAVLLGLPRWLRGKESACQRRRCGFNPWVGKITWRRDWQPAPVFLPGKSHGETSLADCSPWSHRESDTTEQLSTWALLLGYLGAEHHGKLSSVTQAHSREDIRLNPQIVYSPGR